MTTGDLTHLVRTAHGDAWEVEGRLRTPYGGGAARVRGARLMASGIKQPKWNNADATASDVDLEALTAWYSARDLPWGMRVPLELTVELGTPLFVKRCAGLLLEAFPGSANQLGDVRVRRCEPGFATAYAGLDASVFGSDLAESQAWVYPQFDAPGFRHWIAEVGGMPVGIATTVRSNGEAGPAAYLCGLGALPGSPPEALDCLVAVAIGDAFDAGADLVHANPDDDASMQRLAALGAIEVPGFLVRVVIGA